MVHQEHTAYIWYLKNVLGIQQFLAPVAPSVPLQDTDPLSLNADRGEASNKGPELKILFVDEQSWDPGAQQLFEKMREAMGVQAQEVKVLSGKSLSPEELEFQKILCRQIVIFKDSIQEIELPAIDLKSSPLNSQQTSMTISPRTLLRRPELKRRAWEDLKLVMQRLNKGL